jgi:hypothetical protein
MTRGACDKLQTERSAYLRVAARFVYAAPGILAVIKNEKV